MNVLWEQLGNRAEWSHTSRAFSFGNRASLPVPGDTGAGKYCAYGCFCVSSSDARDRTAANTVAVLLCNTLFLHSRLKMQIVGFAYYIWLSMKSSCGIQSIYVAKQNPDLRRLFWGSSGEQQLHKFSAAAAALVFQFPVWYPAQHKNIAVLRLLLASILWTSTLL